MKKKKLAISIVLLVTVMLLVQINIFKPRAVQAQTGTSVNSIGVPASQLTQTNANGMNINAAESTYTSGNSNILIAYIEGGINLHNTGFVDSIDSALYINWHETPVPCQGTTLAGATMVIGGVTQPCSLYYSNNIKDYEINGQTSVNALDWANDPRVHDVNGNGIIDPEDVLVAFSNNVNNDKSGYPNDIFGWDFYDNQNDPATQDSAYQHSDDQMSVIHRLCPKCMIMPIRAGDEALDAGTNLAQAWTYACSQGVNIIVSVTADLSMYLYTTTVIPRRSLSTRFPELHTANTYRLGDPLSWPGGPGSWNPQYGYGMPNVDAAMNLIAAGNIPPTVQINSPSWYSIEDPTSTPQVQVDATINYSQPYTYTLYYGLGQDPTQWTPINTGLGTGNYSGPVGTLNTSLIPSGFYNNPMALSPGNSSLTANQQKELATADQYDLTFKIKVVANANSSLTGVDRRVVYAIHDSSWLNGAPMKFSSSIESQPALVDLQGSGHLDMVFATSGGQINAIDPTTGKELPGWPQYTDPLKTVGNSGVNFGNEEVLEPVAVGDLYHTGQLDVVVTSLSGHVYAYNAYGKLLPGWPVSVDTGSTLVPPTPIPRPSNPFTRSPISAFLAPPVLADLSGNGQLDVIQAGLDGRIYIWQPNGTLLPNWPVKVSLPSGFTVKSGYSLINDPRIISPPTIAYFNGPNNPPDLVIRTQYTEITGPGTNPLPFSISMAYNLQGQLLPGWPVVLQGILEYYGSAMDAVTEGTANPIAYPTSGGVDQVIIEPLWTPPYIVSGNGTTTSTLANNFSGNLGNVRAAANSLLAIQSNPLLTLSPSTMPPDNPIPFTGGGAVGKVNGTLSFASAEIGTASFAGSELVDSSGIAINNYVDTYPLSGTTTNPSPFQALKQGADFLGSPVIADVNGGSVQNDVIDGGDSNVLAAYQPNGQLVPGFPKFTTGWTINAPAVGDLLSNGTNDIVAGTRDGYLFVWTTGGSASHNNQWWRSDANEWNQNRYGSITRPPGIVQSITQSGTQISFKAPGSTWYTGQASDYKLTYSPSGQVVTIPATVSAGNTQTLDVIAGQTSVSIQAVNSAGLLATPITYTFATASNTSNTGGSTTTSGPTNSGSTTQTTVGSQAVSTVSLSGNTGKGFLRQFFGALALLIAGIFLVVKLKASNVKANKHGFRK